MRKKKGFTVLELAIVITFTAVLFGAVGSMVTIASNMIRYSDNKSDLQKQAQTIQEKFSYIGMQAKEFNTVETDEEYTIKTVEDHEYTIEFKKIQGQDNTFSDILVNNETYMYVDDDKKNIMITELNINKNNNVINISFNLEKGSNKNKVIYPVGITFYLRNN
ncbi:hypothetical protein GND98_007970 [Clostridium butyricum]|uniref:Prepilin-type N-terminal cleavage/methylation domain-containing protein n=1 Tax=Clostridium butyricum TaxID=1492 RepID=A0A6L9EMU0_CLOBU|nr:hypothetical protein [Clostridium butyricum]